MSQTYTLFLPDGTPVRARIAVLPTLPAGLTPRALLDMSRAQGTAAASIAAQTDWSFLRQRAAWVEPARAGTGLGGLVAINLRDMVPAERRALQMWATLTQRGAPAGPASTLRLVGNDAGRATRWSIRNAFPLKVQGPALPAGGNDVAMEEITLVHEGFIRD